MSLQSAVAGFGAYCMQSNIIFTIPLLGRVTLGAKHADILESLSYSCQRQVSLSYDGGDCHFVDASGDVLTLTFNGIYISRIKFHGAASQIPQNLIYTYNGKSYLTNVSIDGHMMRIKNMNEIKVMKVSNIPSVPLSLSQLGVTIERTSAAYAARISAAGERFRGSSFTQQVVELPQSVVTELSGDKDTLERNISKLRNKKYDLHSKLTQYTCVVDRYKSKVEEYQVQYKTALSRLNGTYGYAKFSLKALIQQGKLVKDSYGAWSLAKESQVPTFYTEEDAVDFETMHSTPPKGSEIVDVVRYDGPFSTTYTVAHRYKKQVAHRDEAYYCAKEWCNSRAYGVRHDELVSLYNTMLPYIQELARARAQADAYSKTPEYIALCVEFNNVTKELELEQSKLTVLNSKLYNN